MTERERNQAAKAWLKRYGDAREDVRRLQMEWKELQARQEGADAIKYSDMPKACLSDADLSDMMVQREKVAKRITKAMTKAYGIMNAVGAAIDEVEDPMARTVLSLRYITLRSWDDICEEMRYSWTRVHELHRKGLGEIWRITKYEKV